MASEEKQFGQEMETRFGKKIAHRCTVKRQLAGFRGSFCTKQCRFGPVRTGDGYTDFRIRYGDFGGLESRTGFSRTSARSRANNNVPGHPIFGREGLVAGTFGRFGGICRATTRGAIRGDRNRGYATHTIVCIAV